MFGQRKRRRLAISVLLMLTLALTGLASSVGAAAAPTVVASGLNAPRYIAMLDDGTIYVTEAGTGGTEVLPADPEAPANAPLATRGTTGQVTRIAPNGAKTVVAQGLPSYNLDGPTG